MCTYEKFIHTHVCVYAYIFALSLVNGCVIIHKYIHNEKVCVYAYIFALPLVKVCVIIHTYIHSEKYSYMHTHTCVCIHIYIALGQRVCNDTYLHI
jgi:hypothetical protein